jgi:hypothetical protein
VKEREGDKEEKKEIERKIIINKIYSMNSKYKHIYYSY